MGEREVQEIERGEREREREREREKKERERDSTFFICVSV
jgi:hypothetical protein